MHRVIVTRSVSEGEPVNRFDPRLRFGLRLKATLNLRLDTALGYPIATGLTRLRFVLVLTEYNPSRIGGKSSVPPARDAIAQSPPPRIRSGRVGRYGLESAAFVD